MGNLRNSFCYHYVYRTTNLLTGQFYIGKHSADSLVNDYLGSGLRLLRSIRKYGRNSFHKQVLFVFFTSNEAFDKEKRLIGMFLFSDKLCLNIATGGEGGDLGAEINRSKGFKISETMKKRGTSAGVNNPFFGKDRSGKKNPMFGRKHSEETKEKNRKYQLSRPPASLQTRERISKSRRKAAHQE